MSAVADVLNGAADLIERDGWCQGAEHLPTGERCVDGALGDVAPSYGPVLSEAIDALRKFVKARSTAWDWNDTPGRTKAEVVAALRAAAERAS